MQALSPHAAYRLDIAKFGNTHHKCGKYQRGDNHLHHPYKNGGKQFYVFADLINGFGACCFVDDNTRNNARNHSGQYINGEFVLLHEKVMAILIEVAK
jgi:hypothetical protein